MELLSGLSAINAAIGIGKSVVQADHAIDTATLKSNLANMMSELANAKIAQIELVERIRELEEENSRLKGASESIDQLIESGGYRYQPSADGSPLGWPACPACIAKDKRITLLVQDGDIQSAKCPSCDANFKPVTWFTAPGRTAVQDRNERRARSQAEMNARIAQLDRNSPY